MGSWKVKIELTELKEYPGGLKKKPAPNTNSNSCFTLSILTALFPEQLECLWTFWDTCSTCRFRNFTTTSLVQTAVGKLQEFVVYCKVHWGKNINSSSCFQFPAARKKKLFCASELFFLTHVYLSINCFLLRKLTTNRFWTGSLYF